jgi:hypothetical protein
MSIHHGVRVFSCTVGIFALGAVCGCGSSNARYEPSADQARTALEAALKTWVAGQPASAVEATPAVRVVDSGWQNGQQLASFEVLSEKDGDDGAKEFTVRLTLKGTSKKPKAEGKDVRYVVHGRDPVWVYNAEDYRRVLDMDNNPTGPTNGARPAGRRAPARG